MAVLTGALPPRSGGDDGLELETDRTHRGEGMQQTAPGSGVQLPVLTLLHGLA